MHRTETAEVEASRPSLQWLALQADLSLNERQWLQFADRVRQYSDLHVAFLVRTIWRDLEFCHGMDAIVQVAHQAAEDDIAARAVDDHNIGYTSMRRKLRELIARIESGNERLGQ